MFTGIVEEKGSVRYMQLTGESGSSGNQGEEGIGKNEDR